MKIIKEVITWINLIVIAVAIALVINIFVFQPTQVVGCSMESTLHDKDKIIVSKLVHTFSRQPDYGEIVIIDSRINRPHTFMDDLTDYLKSNLITYRLFNSNNEVYWIKRVIAKEGDTLEFKDGKVYRNGKVLKEPYIKEPMRFYSDKKIVVPENHLFVMGDNRNNSRDSRHIGCIPLDHVVGKYIFKF